MIERVNAIKLIPIILITSTTKKENHTFLYDANGKVTKIKVTSNKTKTCYNTFTFDLNYGFY